MDMTVPPIEKKRYRPIGRIEDYIFGLERAGATPEQLAEVRRKNMYTPPPQPVKKESKEPQIRFLEDSPPLLRLHQEYMSKGVRPPMKDMVQAYEEAGFSKEKIARIKKFYITETRNEEKNQKMIDKLFAKYKCKPARTAPKKVLKVVKKRT